MKERLEGDLPGVDQSTRSDHPNISEAQRRKEREIVAKEVNDIILYIHEIKPGIELVCS